MTENLKLASNAICHNKKTLTPRLAGCNDEELNKLLSRVTIAQGGVLPNIQHLPEKTKSHKPVKAK
ncbi:unnamed protein product [Staurois parvus]|uniref:Histone H2A C-terminal domain-containing protein n=1 Tax=Staurois parvus TaxID=386267 RepID=A0ABN9HTT2_9NEOB|nr:unnamed protein product [Staurois parvus]